MPSCGVLALQGDWHAHRAVLAALGAECCTVRTASDLDGVGGLVLPGGESSAMLRLMEGGDLFERIRERMAGGMAVLATCAGVILLAQRVVPDQRCFGALAVEVVRNAYGRQVHSSVEGVEVEPPLAPPRLMEGVFIRAPRISGVGDEVDVLGMRGNDPVIVRQGRVLGVTFHPELSGDSRVHELFLRITGGQDG